MARRIFGTDAFPCDPYPYPLRKGKRKEKKRRECFPAMRLTITSLEHAERMQIGFEQRLLLLALVDILFAQADNNTQRLDVKAVALGLGVDVADIIGDRLFLFLHPFDPLDEGFELIFGETAGGLIVFDGGCSSHWALRGAGLE